MKSIFDYTSYREFLKEHFKEKKEKSSHFSLGVWARILDVSNRSVLANVLNGNRHPGKELQKKFVNYFSFTIDEEKFFCDLVSLMKVQDKKEKIDMMIESVQKRNGQIPKMAIVREVVYMTSEELQKMKGIMSTFKTKYDDKQKAYCLNIDLKNLQSV